MSTIATWIGYAVLGLWLMIFAAVLLAGTWAAVHENARERYRVGRPQPRTDHDCDPLAGAPNQTERMIGLYCAHRELEAAAERVEGRAA